MSGCQLDCSMSLSLAALLTGLMQVCWLYMWLLTVADDYAAHAVP